MTSVVIKSTDPKQIEQAVQDYAARLREEHPEVQRVIGIDLVAYTRTEFEQLAERSPGWHAAIASGRDL